MNLNSKKFQNIFIVVLVLALILTFYIDAIQASIDRNEVASIKERPAIKNTLKDYIVEEKEDEALYEIELDPESVVEEEVIEEEIVDEVIDTSEDYVTPDNSYEEDYDNSYNEDYVEPAPPVVTPPPVVETPDPPVVTPTPPVEVPEETPEEVPEEIPEETPEVPPVDPPVETPEE